MSRAKNVVWSEGLFLTPHVFQQADRYRDEILHFRLMPLNPFFWGVSALELDRDGLANGFFTVYRCAGVMPDGLVIRSPDEDQAPEPRSFKDRFPPSAQTLDVYLAIQATAAGGVNCTLANGGGDHSTRFQMELARIPDDTAENNESEIPVAKKNFQILFSGESLEGKVWLKVAELGRTATGTVILNDAAYIPPSITLSASDTLMMIMHRILETLAAKSAALSQQRRHITEFGSSDVANFWLLHTVNSYVPILSHYYYVPKRHPEQLYLVLSQLVGELSTFSLQADPRDVPRYDHENQFKTFDELEKKIRFLLDTIIPAKYVIIPLEKTPEAWYVGQINDDRLLQTAQFYLAANAQVAPNRLIDDVPAKAKISSPDEIGMLIGRAVPGITLSHEPIPPSGIPVRAGFKYFHLHTQGRWWDVICKARRLALYLPDEFPDLKTELVAIKE
jgi:type VI secretion system protein ImpJ